MKVINVGELIEPALGTVDVRFTLLLLMAFWLIKTVIHIEECRF
jgi:hypothetical protein